MLTLVPDRRDDGTNVIAVPTDVSFQFSYGPGSFRRHLRSAIAAGLSVRVRRDPLLAARHRHSVRPRPPTRPGSAPDMAANEPGQPALASAAFTHNLAVPASALAIGAHPDDVEFGCGATLAKWADAGCVVHHLICTDGSKGTWNPDADVLALTTQRRCEQGEAARRLERRQRRIGDVPRPVSTASSTAIWPTRGEVARVIRELRPDVVLGHDPWKRYRLHPDHRHAGLLACEGIVAARDPHFFRDQGSGRASADRAVAVGGRRAGSRRRRRRRRSAIRPRKLDALEAHVSQFESTMKAVDADHLAAFRTRINDRLARAR